MLKRLSLLAVVGALFVVGCKSDSKDEAKTSTADYCSHCEGVQTVTVDGKCPMCGMVMK